MKRNFIILFITTFLLCFISVAYAAFNSELTITGEGTVQKDTTPPTCGAWYLRDSSLTIQEAYNQNKFINPGTNTTWTNTDKKLFIQCSDNMPGSYGCLNVTEITDSNNQKRYYKEVKEYTSNIKTDGEVSVTLQDAYLNSRTCTLPAGGSKPYLDKQGPTVTITQSAANKFTYIATDNFEVLGYMVTTSSTEPALDDSNWVSDPSEVTIDNTAAHTYYVWAKDGVNITHETIETFLLTKTEGTGTTLTLKYNNNSGAALTTGYVLKGTIVYVEASLKNRYTNLTISKNNTNITNPSTVTINENTIISSNATFNGIYAYFNSDGGSVYPILKGVFTGEVYGELPIPEKEGYSFAGWSELPQGYKEIEYIESTGTQYIDTGVAANTIYGLEFKYLPAGNVSYYDSYLSGALDDFTLARWYIGNNKAYIRHRGNEVTIDLNVDTTNINKLTIKNNVIKGNNDTYNIDTTNPIATTSSNLFIFNNSSLNRYSIIKVYSLKLYNENNQVIRDYIPCIEESSGKAGLYDLVNDVFYGNEGTGEFITGPRKFITSTSIVERTTDHTLTAVWDKIITVTFDPNGGSVNPVSKTVTMGSPYGTLPTPTKTGYTLNGWYKLPNGFEEIDYLESTGSKIIDTGVTFNNDTDRFELDYQANDATGNYFIAGSGYSQKGKMWVYSYKSGSRFSIYITDTSGSQREFYGFAGPDAQRHMVVYDSKKLIIDGSLKADNSSYTFGETPLNFSLFNATESGTTYASKAKIYSFKMYKSGVLTRYMVPCKNTSTNVSGLYDIVEKKFYTFDSNPVSYSEGIITSSSIVQTSSNHNIYALWTPNALTFNNQTLDAGTYGTAYTSNAFTKASNGTGSYTYSIVSGAPAGATINSTNRTISFTSSTNAGTYNVVVRATDNNSGVIKDATMSITINKGTPTLNATTPQTLTYPTASTISYTYTGDGTVTCATSSSTYATCSVNTSTKKLTITPVKPNGSTTVTITLKAAAGTNYKAATDKVITVTINKGTPTLNATTPQTLTYPTASTISYTYTGDGTVTCATSSSTYATCSVNTSTKKLTITPVKPNGSTTVTITLKAAAGTYYKAATNKVITVTINKGTCPAPTNVAISTAGKVTWTVPSGASSSQISIDNSTYAAATSGVDYSSTIKASTGTRKVYVRSVCSTTYYSQYSTGTSKSTGVYSITLTKGSNITSVSPSSSTKYIIGSANTSRNITISATVTAPSTDWQTSNSHRWKLKVATPTSSGSGSLSFSKDSSTTNKYNATVTLKDGEGNKSYTIKETYGKTSCQEEVSNIKSFKYYNFKGCFDSGSGSGCDLAGGQSAKTNGDYCIWGPYTGNGPQIPIYDIYGSLWGTYYKVNVVNGYASVFVYCDSNNVLRYQYQFDYEYTLYEGGTVTGKSSSAAGRLNSAGSIANAFFSSFRWVNSSCP